MTFQAIRAHIETKVNTAFQALVPPIEVMVTTCRRRHQLCRMSFA